MVPEASSDPNKRSHLRLVGGVPAVAADEARKHIQTDGEPVLTPAALRAKAIRSEAAFFHASKSAATSAPQAPIAEEAPLDDVPAVASEVPLEQLGSRFEALATPVSVERPEEAERISEAFDALRSSVLLTSYSELWPTTHLPDLIAQDAPSVGRWVIALLTQLHRVSPTGLLDLRMASGQTIRAAARGNETRLDWAASPSRRIPSVKCSEARLAQLALGQRKARRRQREGVDLLRRLAALPVSLGDLASAGAVIDPFAFWQLIRVSRPAVLDGVPSLVAHVDPLRPAYDVTVDLTPGTPISIRLGANPDADCRIVTAASDVLGWAVGQEAGSGGSGHLDLGDADAELAALRVIGSSRSPIRQSS